MRNAGRTGARLVALATALIVLVLAFAFFGLAMARLPFAAITAAGALAAGLYAHLMWRAFARRDGRPSTSGAIVAGAGAAVGLLALAIARRHPSAPG
jgi:hypothetical protein